jgi:hypothetical protein
MPADIEVPVAWVGALPEQRQDTFVLGSLDDDLLQLDLVNSGVNNTETQNLAYVGSGAVVPCDLSNVTRLSSFSSIWAVLLGGRPPPRLRVVRDV